MNMEQRKEMWPIVHQYRILSVLMYAKYHMRKDMPTTNLIDYNNFDMLNELRDIGAICIVRQDNMGTWYNITPKGEELYEDYSSLIADNSPKNLMRSKEDISRYIQKLKYAAKYASRVKARKELKE